MSTDAHARPSGEAPEPLYDVNVPTPTHAERARTLVAQISTGTLCTLAIEPAGYPYGSFVTVAFEAGNPVFLISSLAEHTRNLERDPRASLLVAEDGAADPLANGRVTMLGPCTRVDNDGGSARAAFLAAHPNAAYYADFRDFGFWRLRVDAVRYIGGYGSGQRRIGIMSTRGERSRREAPFMAPIVSTAR
jgi:heme iron utilization protein